VESIHGTVCYRRTSSKYISKLFSTGHIQSWEDVGDDLKKFIFKSLLTMSSECSFQDDPITILAARGGHALQSYHCSGELGWSVEKDFHESFLMWHMAVNTFEREYSSDSTHFNSWENQSISFLMWHMPFPMQILRKVLTSS
jgi:tRNA splicing ligase